MLIILTLYRNDCLVNKTDCLVLLFTKMTVWSTKNLIILTLYKNDCLVITVHSCLHGQDKFHYFFFTQVFKRSWNSGLLRCEKFVQFSQLVIKNCDRYLLIVVNKHCFDYDFHWTLGFKQSGTTAGTMHKFLFTLCTRNGATTFYTSLLKKFTVLSLVIVVHKVFFLFLTLIFLTSLILLYYPQTILQFSSLAALYILNTYLSTFIFTS